MTTQQRDKCIDTVNTHDLHHQLAQPDNTMMWWSNSKHNKNTKHNVFKHNWIIVSMRRVTIFFILLNLNGIKYRFLLCIFAYLWWMIRCEYVCVCACAPYFAVNVKYNNKTILDDHFVFCHCRHSRFMSNLSIKCAPLETNVKRISILPQCATLYNAIYIFFIYSALNRRLTHKSNSFYQFRNITSIDSVHARARTFAEIFPFAYCFHKQIVFIVLTSARIIFCLFTWSFFCEEATPFSFKGRSSNKKCNNLNHKDRFYHDLKLIYSYKWKKLNNHMFEYPWHSVKIN